MSLNRSLLVEYVNSSCDETVAFATEIAPLYKDLIMVGLAKKLAKLAADPNFGVEHARACRWLFDTDEQKPEPHPAALKYVRGNLRSLASGKLGDSRDYLRKLQPLHPFIAKDIDQDESNTMAKDAEDVAMYVERSRHPRLPDERLREEIYKAVVRALDTVYIH